jgi:sulfur-carrier protein adenylyltransferase/sulfurtransferase
MRDSEIGVSRLRDEAVRKVGEWLSSLGGDVLPLGPNELRSYAKRQAFAGWRVRVSIARGIEVLDLVLDRRFPRSPARVAFVSRPSDVILPHVEGDGVLCLYPSSAATRSSDPVGVVQGALGEAVQLVEDLRGGLRDQDLRDEFLSYWSLRTGDLTVLSLINPAVSSRIVRVWLGAIPVVAEDDETIRLWLGNRYSRARPFRALATNAVLLWFERALLPTEYPRSSRDILELANRAVGQGRSLLEAVASTSDGSILVLLGATTATGPCLAAVTIQRPPKIENGFRSGRMPPELFTSRFFGEIKVTCGTVTRVDAEWVHGRGADERQRRLTSCKVAILGCGSIGSQVAVALAQAGVGRLVLVDPQNLDSANIGRHALGADDLHKSKAEALAHRIRARFPHVRSIEARNSEWDEALSKEPALFQQCDLIVSAIGSWGAESSLNEWHLAMSRPHPIVYAWTEAHACAGHAVAICDVGGCLQCGFSEVGEFLTPVTKWPDGATTLQEPACGTQYQPYGPVEIMFICAMVVELSFDVLLGSVTRSTRRTWVGRRSLLVGVGGQLTDHWQAASAAAPDGGFQNEGRWAVTAVCLECGRPPS